MAKVAEMESAKLPSDAVRYVRPNGASSGFRDWAAECTGYAHEVCEMALARVIGNKSEAGYQRDDMFEKRRRLMIAWSASCGSSGTAGADVTPIRKAEAS